LKVNKFLDMKNILKIIKKSQWIANIVCGLIVALIVTIIGFFIKFSTIVDILNSILCYKIPVWIILVAHLTLGFCVFVYKKFFTRKKTLDKNSNITRKRRSSNYWEERRNGPYW